MTYSVWCPWIWGGGNICGDTIAECGSVSGSPDLGGLKPNIRRKVRFIEASYQSSM